MIQIILLQIHKETGTSQRVTDVSSICNLIFHERTRSAIWWNTRKKFNATFYSIVLDVSIKREIYCFITFFGVQVKGWWPLVSEGAAVPKKSNIKRCMTRPFFYHIKKLMLLITNEKPGLLHVSTVFKMYLFHVTLVYFCILEKEKYS